MHRFVCILVVALLSFPALSGLVHALHCHGHGAGQLHYDEGHHDEGHHHGDGHGTQLHCSDCGRSAGSRESCGTRCDAQDCSTTPVEAHSAIGGIHPPASCCGQFAHWPLLGIVGTPPRGDDRVTFPPAPLIATIWATIWSEEGSGATAARGWATRPALHDPGGGRRLATLRSTRLIV